MLAQNQAKRWIYSNRAVTYLIEQSDKFSCDCSIRVSLSLGIICMLASGYIFSCKENIHLAFTIPGITPGIICDRISHNQASTHTKSNLRLYQTWIGSLIHYHIPHCAYFRTGKSGFRGSFLPTLSKPRVGDWCH